MSIISVKERRPADDSRNEQRQEDTRHFVVVCDTPNESPSAVSRAEDPNTGLAVPRYGSQLTVTSPQILLDKQLTRNDSQPRVWYIECRYGLPDEIERTEEGTQPDLPELESPVCRVWYETADRVVDSVWIQDNTALPEIVWNEFALVNAAGAKFPEPLIGQTILPIVELQRNVSKETNVLQRLLTFAGTYSANIVFAEEPDDRFARMRGMNYQKFFRLSRAATDDDLIQEYWQETLTIAYVKPFRLLQQGDVYRHAGVWDIPFANAGRSRVGLLNVLGGPLGGFDDDGQPIGKESEEFPAVYTPEMFDEEPISWAALNLPTSLDEIQATLWFPNR